MTVTLQEQHKSLLTALLELLQAIERCESYDELRAQVARTNEVVRLERIPTLPEEPGR